MKNFTDKVKGIISGGIGVDDIDVLTNKIVNAANEYRDECLKQSETTIESVNMSYLACKGELDKVKQEKLKLEKTLNAIWTIIEGA